jgi:hypothetical protein
MGKLAYGQAGPSYALQVATALLGEDPLLRGAQEAPRQSKLNFGKAAPTVAEAFLAQKMPEAAGAAPSIPQQAPMTPSFREAGRAPASNRVQDDMAGMPASNVLKFTGGRSQSIGDIPSRYRDILNTKIPSPVHNGYAGITPTLEEVLLGLGAGKAFESYFDNRKNYPKRDPQSDPPEISQESAPAEDQALYGNFDRHNESLYGNPEAYLDSIDQSKVPESIKKTEREMLADDLGRDPQSDRSNAPQEFSQLSRKMNRGIQNAAESLIRETWTPDQISAIKADVSADQAKLSALAGLYDRFGNNREKVANYILEMHQKDPSGPWSGLAGKMKQLVEQGKGHVVEPPKAPTLQDFRPRMAPENWKPGTSLVPADVLLDPRNRLA